MQQRCVDVSNRCVQLMLALRDSSAGLEGHKALEFADDIVEYETNHFSPKRSLIPSIALSDRCIRSPQSGRHSIG